MSIGDTKARLVGDVMPRYCYWVVTTEGKKMPVECLQFSRETESFDNSAQDPFKEIDESIFKNFGGQRFRGGGSIVDPFNRKTIIEKKILKRGSSGSYKKLHKVNKFVY